MLLQDTREEQALLAVNMQTLKAQMACSLERLIILLVGSKDLGSSASATVGGIHALHACLPVRKQFSTLLLPCYWHRAPCSAAAARPESKRCKALDGSLWMHYPVILWHCTGKLPNDEEAASLSLPHAKTKSPRSSAVAPAGTHPSAVSKGNILGHLICCLGITLSNIAGAHPYEPRASHAQNTQSSVLK